ncbi:hypothetical protein EW146_g9144 [Bondarzewia mesenterica]|uniref:Uncharacterized protein n=1 Tax=Bondarzewia mesenterica TaxID=1095465 RepID=A0A4S4LAL3_9AGAM|nr:hypothetical protein EW146_g9144 [Bondarzewia mesenterica]
MPPSNMVATGSTVPDYKGRWERQFERHSSEHALQTLLSCLTPSASTQFAFPLRHPDTQMDNYLDIQPLLRQTHTPSVSKEDLGKSQSTDDLGFGEEGQAQAPLLPEDTRSDGEKRNSKGEGKKSNRSSRFSLRSALDTLTGKPKKYSQIDDVSRRK